MKYPRSFSLFTLILILVLLSLGTWQLRRKVEKETLLETLEHNKQKPAKNVDSITAPEPFIPLYAEGHFLPGKTIFLQSKVHQGKNGIYVLDVFKTQKGKFLLIQRGWSQTDSLSSPPEDVKVEGIARTPSPPTYFQPANTPPTYFWIDLKALSQEFEVPLLPYYIVAKNSQDPRILPTPPFPMPPNKHLQYAITWYGLAFALGVMLLWSRKYYRTQENS